MLPTLKVKYLQQSNPDNIHAACLTKRGRQITNKNNLHHEGKGRRKGLNMMQVVLLYRATM